MKFTILIFTIVNLLLIGAVTAQQTKRPKKKMPVPPTQTRSADTAQFKMENPPGALLDVIVVDHRATDKIYEIRGIGDFLRRPFSDFKWISGDVLQFER